MRLSWTKASPSIITTVSCGIEWLYVLLFPYFVKAQLKVNNYDAVIVMGVAGLCQDGFVVANSVHRQWFKYSLSLTKKFTLKWCLKILNVRHYVVMWLEHLQYQSGSYRKVIAVSEPIKDELHVNYGVPRSQIEVLPNGADFKALTPNLSVRVEARAALKVADDEILLCMLVNELERKGVRQVMSAMKILSNYPLKLLVVGRFEQADCAQIANEVGVADRVIVRPSTNDVKRYLWASDLYTLPTQYEAWNLSIMEAQAAGLAVITTRLVEADLVVAPEQSGYLLEDPLDVNELVAALQKWLNNPDKTAMSLMARERAERFSWENLVEQLSNIIEGKAANVFENIKSPAIV